MGFTRSTADLKVHQKLSDYPRVEDGVSAEELKKRFDAPAEQLQKDLNNLQEELEGVLSASKIGANTLDSNDTSENNVQAKLEKIRSEIQNTVLGQIPDSSIDKTKMDPNYDSTLAKKDGTVQENLNANYLEGKNLAGIKEIMTGQFKTGTFTGNGEQTLTINVGFRPKFMIYIGSGSYGGKIITVVIGNTCMSISGSDMIGFSVSLFDTGVTLTGSSAGKPTVSGGTYTWIALKEVIE